MSNGFEGSCQRTELATTDRQEPSATLKEDRPAQSQNQLRSSLDAVPDELIWLNAEWECAEGFHEDRYPKAPRFSPPWAKRNWRDAIRASKGSGFPASFIKALTHDRVNDLHSLVESLKSCPPHQKDKVQSAWKSYHRTWVAVQVCGMRRRKQPATRNDPYSLRSTKVHFPQRINARGRLSESSNRANRAVQANETGSRAKKSALSKPGRRLKNSSKNFCGSSSLTESQSATSSGNATWRKVRR